MLAPPPPGQRYRARLFYDGTDFDGSQVQPFPRRTVAGTLEAAIATRMQQQVRVVPASRTDAGVHARGQAVHFDLHPTSTRRELPNSDDLHASLNALLPSDLRVADIEEANEIDGAGRPWHARRWATGKLYSYRLSVGRSRSYDPLGRRSRHHAGAALDPAAMREAAAWMIGDVDCAAFANRRAGEPPPREMEEAVTRRIVRSIDVVDEGSGRLRCDFHVKSALFKMVRNMMGLMLAVGCNRYDAADVPELIGARDRDRLPPPAPALGLTLESVYYCTGWDGRYDSPIHTLTAAQRAQWDHECLGLSRSG